MPPSISLIPHKFDYFLEKFYRSIIRIIDNYPNRLKLVRDFIIVNLSKHLTKQPKNCS